MHPWDSGLIAKWSVRYEPYTLTRTHDSYTNIKTHQIIKIVGHECLYIYGKYYLVWKSSCTILTNSVNYKVITSQYFLSHHDFRMLLAYSYFVQFCAMVFCTL